MASPGLTQSEIDERKMREILRTQRGAGSRVSRADALGVPVGEAFRQAAAVGGPALRDPIADAQQRMVEAALAEREGRAVIGDPRFLTPEQAGKRSELIEGVRAGGSMRDIVASQSGGAAGMSRVPTTVGLDPDRLAAARQQREAVERAVLQAETARREGDRRMAIGESPEERIAMTTGDAAVRAAQAEAGGQVGAAKAEADANRILQQLLLQQKTAEAQKEREFKASEGGMERSLQETLLDKQLGAASKQTPLEDLQTKIAELELQQRTSELDKQSRTQVTERFSDQFLKDIRSAGGGFFSAVSGPEMEQAARQAMSEVERIKAENPDIGAELERALIRELQSARGQTSGFLSAPISRTLGLFMGETPGDRRKARNVIDDIIRQTLQQQQVAQAG